jgi:CRISPR-associated protein Cas2
VPFEATWTPIPLFTRGEVMVVVVSYDVSTLDKAGRRRLRRVARACLDFGQRVQKSVFECDLGDKEWAELKGRLLSEYDPAKDSLRFYYLGEDARRRTEHHGANPLRDLKGALVV